jgi:hypothetical protein
LSIKDMNTDALKRGGRFTSYGSMEKSTGDPRRLIFF